MSAPQRTPLRFAVRDSALTVRHAPRGDYRALLNLKSCEMRHPDADALLRDVLRGLDPLDVCRYPYQGDLVAGLATLHDVAAPSLLLTAGSCGAIGLVVSALAQPAGRLLLQEPSFESWRYYAGLHGVPARRCAGLTGDVPTVTTAELRAAMRDTPPSIVAMTNPGNPAGLVVPVAQVAELATLAAAHGHLLAVDECYGAFVGVTHVPLLAEHPNLIVIRSLSKSWALAGARLAVVFAAPEVIDYLSRFRPDSAVSATTIAIATALLSHQDRLRAIWADVATIRDEFADRVRQENPRWTVLRPGGNFVTFGTGTPGAGRALEQGLATHRIRVRGLDDVPGMAGCLRFSLADRTDMGRVADVLAELTTGRDT